MHGMCVGAYAVLRQGTCMIDINKSESLCALDCEATMTLFKCQLTASVNVNIQFNKTVALVNGMLLYVVLSSLEIKLVTAIHSQK